MAQPNEDVAPQPEAFNGKSAPGQPISNIMIVIAMQAEALPLVEKFQLSEFPGGVPWVRYHGSCKDLSINIVCPGKDKYLGLVGKLSSGDALDMAPHDEAFILASDATVKDMEGVAIAYVADLLQVPAIFVKAVTDNKPTAEEFNCCCCP